MMRYQHDAVIGSSRCRYVRKTVCPFGHNGTSHKSAKEPSKSSPSSTTFTRKSSSWEPPQTKSVERVNFHKVEQLDKQKGTPSGDSITTTRMSPLHTLQNPAFPKIKSLTPLLTKSRRHSVGLCYHHLMAGANRQMWTFCPDFRASNGYDGHRRTGAAVTIAPSN